MKITALVNRLLHHQTHSHQNLIADLELNRRLCQDIGPPFGSNGLTREFSQRTAGVKLWINLRSREPSQPEPIFKSATNYE